jgi:hypothetical protein
MKKYPLKEGGSV